VKRTLVISAIILFFIYGYILSYDEYQNNIETAYYLGAVNERATSFSLFLLGKKNDKYNFNKHIKSMIVFDIKILNENKDIKSKINLTRYCETIEYMKNDFNASTKVLINQLCTKK
jgi:hypothetical protein